MAFRSQSLLQFDELKELVASYAGTRAALEQLVDLEVSTDRDSLEAALAETGEAIAYLKEASDAQAGRGAPVRLKFHDTHDVRPSVGILRVEGAWLDGRALLDLFQVLGVAGEHRSLLLGVRERFPRLARRADGMTDLRFLVRRFGKAFLPDGSLADDASLALHRLRRDIEKQQRAIQQSLEHFLRAHKDDGTLQEDFVTVRDGRFVVPVVAGQKGRVTGIIHGSSGSGHTLFMEPLETIEQNNALVRLREDEQREVERILEEITDALREHAEEITHTLEMLIQLDVVFAKASFAADYGATVPRFSIDGARRVVVKEARHPLLERVLRQQRKEVVPVSFTLDEGRRCLLISGPNTGGKTVTLKTAGLLALMAQAALPVPASDAEFPIFDDILADIGDTQSIAESLSSFSGHLIHVKEMMGAATPDSLVLLDELGRATDPEEGGALGVAILDRFRQSGAFCLASTHLLPLKLYGAQTPGVVNASMGFDDATLQPTYQLQVGLPGKSAGIDIATRLQLPADVIRHAREVLPKLEADFQSLLVALQKQLEEAKERTRQLELAQLDVTRLREGVERQAIEREDKRRRDWERKSEDLIRQFDQQAQATLQQIFENAEHRKAADQAQRLVAKAKREFREEASNALAPPEGHPAPTPVPVLAEGMQVRIKDVRDPAVVRRILKNGLLDVEAGYLKMRVSTDDVVEVIGPESGANARGGTGFSLSNAGSRGVTVTTGPRWDVSYREINVIGQHAEEALEQVDKFLDSAALASVNRIRIIHGHGMGVLKRAVAEFLEHNPHVARFYGAPQSEGGAGATIVELRE